MSTDDHQEAVPTDSTTPLPKPNRIGLLGILRLFLAVAITAALPPCWMFLFARLVGIPIRTSGSVLLGTLLFATVLIPLLSVGLLKTATLKKIVGTLALLVFVGVFMGIMLMHVAESLPILILWSVLFSGALCTFWLAWFVPLSNNKFVGTLILMLLLGWGAAIPFLLKFDGLTGDARAKFAWSFAPSNTSVPFSETPTKEMTPLAIPKLDPLDFPEFLGNRQGHLIDRPFDTDWEKNPPKLIWKKPVGKGWSSFALIGDLGITLEQRDQHETVVCYRLSSGEELWKHADETRFNGALGGDGPRSTPTIDDDRVYTIGATGLLNCLDLATGNKKWGIDVLADNGGKEAYHGVCGSPLIMDRMVIVGPTGGPGFSLTAYDKLTGRRLWRSGKWAATYSSPMLARIKGMDQILIYNTMGVEAHDPQDGTLLWSYEWTNIEKTACSQPILIPGTDNQILLSIGYDKGSVLLEIDGEQGKGWTAESLWTSRNMKTKFTTAVILEGDIYGLDDGILACVDLQSGKRKWKGGRYKHGQLLLIGEYLIIQAEDGDLFLVRANPKKLEEIGHLSALSSKTWNNPAINKEYLVVRNDLEAICFQIGSSENGTTSP